MLSSCKLSKAQWQEIQDRAQELEASLQVDPPPLQDMLLEMDRGSVMVRQTIERRSAPGKESAKHRKWPELHKKTCMLNGYVCTPHLHPVARGSPCSGL